MARSNLTARFAFAAAALAACVLAGGEARAGTSKSSFRVSATVVDACSVGIGSTTVSATCTSGAARVLALDGGSFRVQGTARGAPMRVTREIARGATIVTLAF